MAAGPELAAAWSCSSHSYVCRTVLATCVGKAPGPELAANLVAPTAMYNCSIYLCRTVLFTCVGKAPSPELAADLVAPTVPW